jgi:alanyl-tRNA synthetase
VGDGILPGNNGRNYVLRRILRRAILWSRALGLTDPFFYKLVPTVVDQLSPVFPELKKNQPTIEKVLKAEEESFNRTLDNGIALFADFTRSAGVSPAPAGILPGAPSNTTGRDARSSGQDARATVPSQIPGEVAFKLYDTYGFPLDMTELMARERGLTVDTAGFEKLMQEQKERSQAAQKKEIIDVADTDDSIPAVEFVGYDATETSIQLLSSKIEFGKTADDTVKARLYFSPTPFYAEMGGQVGDTGWLEFGNHRIEILDTKKAGRGVAHITEDVALLDELSLPAKAVLDTGRRALIEAHHSATHLLHWALREVLGTTVGQKGSYVGPDRLRFDFSHLEAVKPEELQKVEAMVNEKITANLPVKWQERPYAEVKGDSSIIQFFGDKYGETVRVVDIGGFSKELCAGTHVRETGKIGVFRIVSEGAIAAGVRRIEALCGPAIHTHLEPVFAKQHEEAKALAAKSGTRLKLADLSADPFESWSAFKANESQISNLKSQIAEAEKSAAKNKQAELAKQAASLAPCLLAETTGKLLLKNLGEADPALLQLLAGELKRSFQGVAVLGCSQPGKATLLALVTDGSSNAGAIIKEIAPVVGGKGGGKPDLAQGGGTNPDALPAALEAARAFLAR